METKRLIFAIVLSVAIFMGWQLLTFHMVGEGGKSPLANSTDTVAKSPSAVNPIAPAMPEIKVSKILPEGKTFIVTTPFYEAVFTSQGGILKKFNLLKYKDSLNAKLGSLNLVSEESIPAGPMGLLVNGVPSWAEGQWHVEGSDLTLAEKDTGTLRFIGNINGTVVTRELHFSGATYLIDETTSIATDEKKPINVSYTIGATPLVTLSSPGIFQTLRYALFGGEQPVAKESSMNLTRVTWLKDGSFSEESSTSKLAGKNGEGMLIKDATWIGVMNNYFLRAIVLPGEGATALANYGSGIYRAAIGNTQVMSSPDAPAVTKCTYYFGPKETKALSSSPGDLDKSLHYGIFTVIAKPLLYLLKVIDTFTGNYGIAIILLTVLVKLVLWPISLKAYRSMEEMKKLQPLTQQIKEKFADDKEKMNQEVMALYKRHKVNPAGGCLPIFLQIPVFFALYQVLLNSIELRHASFISTLPFTQLPWLSDLAGPDPFFITPLVMGASMFFQQKLTPTPADPTQAKVMLFMPVVFTFMGLNFPSGLVIYWLTNNIISIGQQYWQIRQNKKN